MKKCLKKSFWKRTAALGLAAVMSVGLCACNGGGGRGAVSQDPSLAKQYVYRMTELAMPELGDDYYIDCMEKVNDRICMIVRVYHYVDYENGNGNETDIRLLSMKEDGTDLQEIKMQLGEEKPEDDTDVTAGNDTGADTGTADTGDAGNSTAGDSTADNGTAGDGSDTAVAEDAAAADTVEPAMDVMVGMENSAYEYTGYGSWSIDESGVIFAIKNHYKEDYSDPENPVYENENYLCAWDIDGNPLWEKDMEGVYDQDNMWIISMNSLGDGSLMMFFGGDSLWKLTADASGNLSELKEIKTQNSSLNNMNRMLVKDDKTAFVLYNNEEDNYNSYITTYDLKTDTFGQGQKLPGSLSWMGYNSVMPGIASDLIFTNSQGVFSYNMGDEQLTQMMSYINSDLSADSFNSILMLDEEHFVACFYDPADDYKMHSGYFTKVKPEEIPDKKVIVIAANYLNYDVKTRVIEFNKENEAYRIVTKEYEQYATNEDYMAGYTQLNNDIIAGNMPDILLADSQMPTENYISKGLLADVGRLIEEDEELSGQEFLQNVFNAYRVNGKLYYVIPNFYVRTFIGKKSLVGDRTGWTMDEFLELMDSLPEGTVGFGDMTREQFLYTLMSYRGSEFVDVSTGKCRFDSPEFIALLEYAATFPKEINYEEYGEDYWMNYESQYRDNRTVLMDMYISSMRDVNRNINGSFGEEVSFVGFPNESGNGAMLGISNYFVLSSKSANLDGAWEFVRYYLTEEYQREHSEWNIPVNKTVFDEWVMKGTQKPYYEDENGNREEYDETYYINGEEIVIEPLSVEEVNRIAEYIQSIETPAFYNEAVQNILIEESAPFFEGQKSAQEVVKVIQSRIQLYVNENR